MPKKQFFSPPHPPLNWRIVFVFGHTLNALTIWIWDEGNLVVPELSLDVFNLKGGAGGGQSSKIMLLAIHTFYETTMWFSLYFWPEIPSVFIPQKNLKNEVYMTLNFLILFWKKMWKKLISNLTKTSTSDKMKCFVNHHFSLLFV